MPQFNSKSFCLLDWTFQTYKCFNPQPYQTKKKPIKLVNILTPKMPIVLSKRSPLQTPPPPTYNSWLPHLDLSLWVNHLCQMLSKTYTVTGLQILQDIFQILSVLEIHRNSLSSEINAKGSISCMLQMSSPWMSPGFGHFPASKSTATSRHCHDRILLDYSKWRTLKVKGINPKVCCQCQIADLILILNPYLY